VYFSLVNSLVSLLLSTYQYYFYLPYGHSFILNLLFNNLDDSCETMEARQSRQPLPLDNVQSKAKLWHCDVCKYSNEPSSIMLAALLSSSPDCYLCSFLLELIAHYHPEAVRDVREVDPNAVVYVTWKYMGSMPGDLYYYPIKLGCPSLWLRLQLFDWYGKHEPLRPNSPSLARFRLMAQATVAC